MIAASFAAASLADDVLILSVACFFSREVLILSEACFLSRLFSVAALAASCAAISSSSF